VNGKTRKRRRVMNKGNDVKKRDEGDQEICWIATGNPEATLAITKTLAILTPFFIAVILVAICGSPS
jgi:hypothetical protein